MTLSWPQAGLSAGSRLALGLDVVTLVAEPLEVVVIVRVGAVVALAADAIATCVVPPRFAVEGQPLAASACPFAGRCNALRPVGGES